MSDRSSNSDDENNQQQLVEGENENADVEFIEEVDGNQNDVIEEDNEDELVNDNGMQLEEIEDEIVDDSEYELSDDSADDDSDQAYDSDLLGEPEPFEVELPTLHQYLGDTTSLRGRNYVEEGGYITIPLLVDSTLLNVMLVPGQTIPLTLFSPLHVSVFKLLIEKDRIFGVLHTKLNRLGTQSMVQYGTTAEIFEYTHNEEANSLTLKARGSQRFKLLKARKESTGLVVGEVKILSDIHLKDPLIHSDLGAIQKLALLSQPVKEDESSDIRSIMSAHPTRSWKTRRWVSMMTPWPDWVYNQYDDKQLAIQLFNEINRAYNFKKEKFIKIPWKPNDISNWACVNLPLDDFQRVELLSLDTPTQRMKYLISITKDTNRSHLLCCTQCGHSLAKLSDIFCMSSEGPHGTFVNPGGYVHEMITVNKTHGLRVFGRPSADHSWFPGYAWTIIVCKNCHIHVGWKFTALKMLLRPQKFFGITRKSVTSKQMNQSLPDSPRI